MLKKLFEKIRGPLEDRSEGDPTVIKKADKALETLDKISQNEIKDLVGAAIKCLPQTPDFTKYNTPAK